MNETMQAKAPFKPDLIIIIRANHLEDGSTTHDVVVGDLILHAVTESEAQDLAEALDDAISANTTQIAVIRYDG